MTRHKVYSAITRAVRSGKLVEPFGPEEFRAACTGLGEGTYKAFLYKHKLGNGTYTELVKQVGVAKFTLLVPYKYSF